MNNYIVNVNNESLNSYVSIKEKDLVDIVSLLR